MLVTVVRGRSKGFGFSCWTIRRAKRKLKDGKLMCKVGKKVLNRSFEYAADAIRHCVLEMNIPEYRIVFDNDVYEDIEKQKQKALALTLREQRIRELADQFLPPRMGLDSLKLMFPGVLEQVLERNLSRIRSEEAAYRRAVGNILYWLEEDIKRFTEEK